MRTRNRAITRGPSAGTWTWWGVGAFTLVKETACAGVQAMKLFCFAALARRDPSAFMIEEKRPDVFVVIQTDVGPNI